MSAPHPLRSRRIAATAVAALFLATSAAACGGGSSDGASAPSEASSSAPSAGGGSSTTVADGGTDAGSAPDADPASSDLDLCAEVTAADVAGILTEADITEAAPNAALGTPTCQYFVEWAGTPLSVVQITWNEDGFLDALRQSNPTATELAGVGDGVAISDDSIVVAGASGDFQIDAGVELTDGGSVASQDQLVAVAQLVEGL